MSKQKTKEEEQADELPYWPSPAYIEACVKELRKKGLRAKKSELTSLILEAYWQKREEILNN